MYLIIRNFATLLRCVYFATLKFRDLGKSCILNHFNFAFLSNTKYIPLAMLLNMSLNEVNRLYQRYNSVKINKTTKTGLYVNSSLY